MEYSALVRVGAAVDEAGLPLGSNQDRVWLAEFDALIDVAADATTDLRARLDAVGAAASLADEIFVARLPKPTLPQPMLLRTSVSGVFY